MTFMNAKKRNKIITYIIVGLVSVGLLATTLPIGISAIGSYLGRNTGDSTDTLKDTADRNFAEAMNLMTRNNGPAAGEKLASAIKGYEQVLKQEPRDLTVLSNLAIAYYYVKNFDKAIDLARQALAIEPKFSAVRINLAVYLFEGKQDAAAAIKELQEIDQADPNYQRAQQFLAEFQAKTPPAKK